MSKINEICADVARVRHVMTFSDIAQSLTKGAMLGQKLNQPLVGAVLNLSMDASKRALLITEELLEEILEKTGDLKEMPEIKEKKLRTKT